MTTTTFAPVLALLNAIIDACFTGPTKDAPVKGGRISSDRGTFRLLNASRSDLETALGSDAASNSWAVGIVTTLGSAHHEYHTVLKAARQLGRAIELPGLLTEAAALGVEVRNPKGITCGGLESLINARRGELFRQTRNLNAKAREVVEQLEFLATKYPAQVSLADVPAITDPDKGIGGAELVAAREVADRLEVSLREKLDRHVKRLTQGRIAELFGNKRGEILLRGTHNLKGDLDRARKEIEKKVENEMKALWDAFQASRKQAKNNAPAAALVASSEVAQQA